MPVRPFLLWAAAALALSACVPKQFLCQERGGPAWTELRSEHFILRTSVSRSHAAEVASKLEGLRQRLLANMVVQPEGSLPPLQVVLRLARGEEWKSAWTAAFPQWKLPLDGFDSALDRELDRFAPT